MKKLISIPTFVVVFSFVVTSLLAQDQKLLGTHDPVMIKAGDTYYQFATGRGIAVASSKDMVNWEREAPVFSEPLAWVNDTIVPGNRPLDIWAPDIAYHNGMYYLYYSVSAFGRNTSAMGVATNKTLDPNSPDFKWVDHGSVVNSIANKHDWNAIDPNLVFDEDGTPWLNFGSWWSGIKMVKLNPDLKTLALPEEWVALAARKVSFLPEDRVNDKPGIEAPFIFKKNGYYYLFVSWDNCCRGVNSNYKVVVGRSTDLKGPYLDKDNVDMRYGGGSIVVKGNEDWPGVGHNSAYTFDGKDYLVFHGYDANDNGRSKLLIKEMKWDADKWPVVEL
ncbi:MAG TPA: arabinan endo-1,5-alpha-L-arabinosidase [Draconibacterium sp.]|nr:arabinan endo-1,5-alpha-L-arabinosidase [Draconibacterium sp.]